jgi:hypothetical protein
MFRNQVAQDVHKTRAGKQVPPKRNPWRVLMAIATSVAVSTVFVGVPMNPVQAAPQVRTVIVSGDCLSSAATSNWQTATGVAPNSGPPFGALFSPSDTLRIENQCNGSQSLFIDPSSFGMPTMPALSTTPIFSDNATWTTGVGGTLNHGKYVDLNFSASTERFVFSQMVTWADNQVAFSGYHGFFAVGDFAVTRGGSSVSQVIGNTTAAISNITVTFSGLGSGGRVNVLNLPPGLVASTCLYPGISCSSPVTISGTPTQDGTFNVGFTFTDLNQTVAIEKSNSLQIIVGSVITPSTMTISGTAGTAITASTAFTPTNFTGAVTYAVTNGTLPAGLSLSTTTGVVSGTPTADSTDTVTITATGATAGSATATVTFAIAAAPTVVPSTQTVSGTAGTAITASTAFTPTNFTGAVTYAVTNGTLPAGLSLSSTTGVVSGTPTAASTATVTITASGATAGTATATITFAIAVAPTTTTTAPAAPTTTVAPAVTTPTTLPDAPQLVTSENQALLESAPGEATAIVNGKAVAVETIKVDAAATTKELEATGQSIVNILNDLTPSGSVNPVKLVKTSDGPVLTGLIVNPYDSTEKLDAPVESVTLVKAGESAVLISALNITNLPAPVAASGSIEVTRGGVLAARSYGLPSLETGEIVLMSTPRLLQKFTVDKDGSFSGQVALPRDVALGSHTVVMATKNVKVSLGITLVATKLMFRIKSTIGTRLFEKRAGVKKVGGIVTVTGAGRCKAKLGKITMNKKPGKCFITVKQAAQGSNRALFSRFTVTVVKKLPKAKKR